MGIEKNKRAGASNRRLFLPNYSYGPRLLAKQSADAVWTFAGAT
jgi:hypothetical protein